jgi:bacteriocin biosynthesis cyclodehydratase domain-containing protein
VLAQHIHIRRRRIRGQAAGVVPPAALPAVTAGRASAVADRCGGDLPVGKRPVNAALESVPSKPLLKPWLRLAADDLQLVFEYAHTSWVLEGPGATALIPVLGPLLDGTRTISEIVSEVGEEFAPAVENALLVLADHRLLVNGPPLPADAPSALAETVWQLAASNSSPIRTPRDILDKLASAKVRVAGSSPAATMLLELLERTGVRSLESPASLAGDFEPCSLMIAVPADVELSELDRLNKATLAEPTTWLPVLPFDGRFASVGPLIVPGETCCYACYVARKAAALRYVETSAMTEMIPAFLPTGPIVHSLLAAVAANIAIRWLGLSDPFLPGRLHTFEVSDGCELTRHDVLRAPRCLACSPAARGPMPFPWIEAATLPASGLGARNN